MCTVNFLCNGFWNHMTKIPCKGSIASFIYSCFSQLDLLLELLRKISIRYCPIKNTFRFKTFYYMFFIKLECQIQNYNHPCYFYTILYWMNYFTTNIWNICDRVEYPINKNCVFVFPHVSVFLHTKIIHKNNIFYPLYSLEVNRA